MTSPDIIEAAARALHDDPYIIVGGEEVQRLAHRIVAVVVPLIRAAALEEAAVVVDDEDGQFSYAGEHRNMAMLQQQCRGLAAAIRALKKQP